MNGKALRSLREKHGYTRRELADIICVGESVVKSWEEGWELVNPSSGEIEEMANAFDMEEEALREILEQDNEDDYEKQKSSFVDYVDFAIRAFRRYKPE